MRMVILMVFATGPAATVACGDGVVTQEGHDNVGEVCLNAASDGTTHATVSFGCINGGCTSLLSAECAMALDGNRVILTGETITDTVRQEGLVCTAECGQPTADCTLASVPDGDYAVEYGEHTAALTVPLPSADSVCAGVTS